MYPRGLAVRNILVPAGLKVEVDGALRGREGRMTRDGPLPVSLAAVNGAAFLTPDVQTIGQIVAGNLEHQRQRLGTDQFVFGSLEYSRRPVLALIVPLQGLQQENPSFSSGPLLFRGGIQRQYLRRRLHRSNGPSFLLREQPALLHCAADCFRRD